MITNNPVTFFHSIYPIIVPMYKILYDDDVFEPHRYGVIKKIGINIYKYTILNEDGLWDFYDNVYGFISQVQYLTFRMKCL